jgi:hypothetical protein
MSSQIPGVKKAPERKNHLTRQYAETLFCYQQLDALFEQED